MKTFLAASMLLVMPMAPAAAADVTHAAEQIVEALAKSVDLGAERGICIGTAQECAASQAPAAADSLDLMVNFELNSAELSEEAKANLLEFAEALKDPRLGDLRFAIEGHTDATGRESYNRRLSERRAAAVVSFLGEQGIDISRFIVVGFGDSRPRSDNPFDPVNRRVETRILE